MEIKKLYTPKPNTPMRVAVLLSGSGTNLEALIRWQTKLNEQGNKDAEIEIVYSNVPDCRGIRIARENGINTAALSSKYFFKRLNKPPDDEASRDHYDTEVIGMIEESVSPDLIVLTGYKRRPGSLFYKKYENRIINMYPGDITKSYLTTGIPASLQAVRNKDPEIRCSVYIDWQNVRFGPLIAQSKPISVKEYNENEISLLDNKIREYAEWKTLPFVVFDLIAKGRVSIDAKGTVYLDNTKLGKNGHRL